MSCNYSTTFLSINYEVVLKLMESAKNLAMKRTTGNALRARKCKFLSRHHLLKRVAKKVITPILGSLGLELRTTGVKDVSTKYVVSSFEKAWSLDFLLYALRERPKLDLELFDHRDRREVIKFVRNKVYTALLSELHISDLFDEDDVRLWRAYDAFSRRIRFRQGCYVLEHSGKEYRLPVNHFEYPVFFHKHGLSEVPRRVLAQVRGKDVIDGGAYIGDSALVLEELEPRAIYAFEPLEENFKLLNETIRINGLRNVVPLKMGLGTAKGVMSVTPFGSASFRSDIFGGGPGEREETTSIDDFVAERKASVGLIKLDVEGSELDVLMGAKKTIEEHKPVLIVSVYHRGRDFFEIPKLIKEIEPRYKMRFLNLNKAVATFERVVLAYVEEHQ